ncbi:DUF2975 domain-containing protein [Algoriphagus namhaensis]|uniref:DUF2975 domain-containing protein n=1 Tax=Algoriphagus namhaensis TaxID=915353 RepID=A0ABV8AN14_9BACT
MLLNSKTTLILKAMRVIAWIAFIGFLIQGFAILGLTIFTSITKTGAEDFYDHADLSVLFEYSEIQFLNFNSFLIVGAFLKATVWYVVIKTLTGFNLSQPFTMNVILKLERISYLLFSIWLIAIIANFHQNYLLHRTGEFFGDKATGEFLFMAGLVFVISQIFKRGVELQDENELTV